VTVFALPVMLSYPEIVDSSGAFRREKRYARGRLEFASRRLRTFYDIARGLGMVKPSEVRLLLPRSRANSIAAKAMLGVLLISGSTRKYRYCPEMTNLEYVRSEELIPDPRKYGFRDRRFWISRIEKGLPPEIIQRWTDAVKRLGLDRFEYGDKEIIAYTKETNMKFVEAWRHN
jgi:hypothetical protein